MLRLFPWEYERQSEGAGTRREARPGHKGTAVSRK